ncbi:TetR family transcriptional regulator [Salinisphaera orenii MK-B5]|uniref:TetR family transcriptional regulator n=1 Tax=Salinisphaera orenii MK-B5 TaxID=856730 RepID=A0A423PUG9_9GAMM|nr:TetR/AcrR family transcriptional regulator [Salinisphaera orenii]ROO29214.1 TetR family transcriptional regulator [Salinisphaera orenii MK-B5]
MNTAAGRDNRAYLLAVAARLFAQQGYHATGMADLERATGLGRSSLYHYFRNKEELLFEITTRYLRALVVEGRALLDVPMAPETRLRRFSRVVMRSVADDRDELTVCFREMHAVTGDNRRTLLALHRDYERVWARILSAGAAADVFRDVDTLTVKAVLGMHHYGYLWLRPDGAQTPEAIADAFCDMLLDGLRGWDEPSNPSSPAAG